MNVEWILLLSRDLLQVPQHREFALGITRLAGR
jgi:hypothetical protein